MEYRNLQIEFSLPCPHFLVTGVFRFATFITTVIARQLRDNPSSQHGPGEQIVLVELYYHRSKPWGRGVSAIPCHVVYCDQALFDAVDRELLSYYFVISQCLAM